MEKIGTESQEGKNHNEIHRYLKAETDFPDNLIRELLSGVPQQIDTRPLKYLDFKAIPKKPDDFSSALVLVHLTDYPPEGGYILPAYDATNKGPSQTEASHRMTIHTSVSSSVAPPFRRRLDSM